MLKLEAFPDLKKSGGVTGDQEAQRQMCILFPCVLKYNFRLMCISCVLSQILWVKSGVGQEFQDTYFGKVEKAFIHFLLKQFNCWQVVYLKYI